MSESSKITVNYFCLGALFIFVGSVLLCALGFTVVLPFEATRTWPQVLCKVVNSSYDSTVCSCDQLSVYDTCVSKYPCLNIYVSYLASSSSYASSNATEGTRAFTFPDVLQVKTITQHVAAMSTLPDESLPRSIARSSFHFIIHRDREQTTPTVDATERFQPANDGSQPDDVVTDDVDVAHHLSNSTTAPLNYDVTVLEDEPSRTVSQMSFGNFTTSPVSDSTDDRVSNATTSALAVEYLRYHDDTTTSSLTSTFSATFSKRSVIENPLSDAGSDGDVVLPAAAVEDTRTAKLYRSWDDSFHPECSLTECGDDVWNIKESRRFRSEWGRVGQSFPCFYNPSRPEATIIERTSPVSAVHAIVWPCLLLFAGTCLWLGLCFGCWSVRSSHNYKDDYTGGAMALR